jgi:hypothetical protein
MSEPSPIIAYFSPYWTWMVATAFVILVGGSFVTTWLATRRIKRDDQ